MSSLDQEIEAVEADGDATKPDEDAKPDDDGPDAQ